MFKENLATAHAPAVGRILEAAAPTLAGGDSYLVRVNGSAAGAFVLARSCLKRVGIRFQAHPMGRDEFCLVLEWSGR